MKSPDKWIRKAYLLALGNVTIGSVNIPVFDRRVPIDIPQPETYVVISSQTKQIADENKCGHGWNCSVLLDIFSQQPTSFVNMQIVDDIEEQISDQLDIWQAKGREIYIPPFVVYHTTFSDSHDILIETPNTTIIRKLVRYNHRLNSIATIPDNLNNDFTYQFDFKLA